jgi:hypothetical protein
MLKDGDDYEYQLAVQERATLTTLSGASEDFK